MDRSIRDFVSKFSSFRRMSLLHSVLSLPVTESLAFSPFFAVYVLYQLTFPEGRVRHVPSPLPFFAFPFSILSSVHNFVHKTLVEIRAISVYNFHRHMKKEK